MPADSGHQAINDSICATFGGRELTGIVSICIRSNDAMPTPSVMYHGAAPPSVGDHLVTACTELNLPRFDYAAIFHEPTCSYQIIRRRGGQQPIIIGGISGYAAGRMNACTLHDAVRSILRDPHAGPMYRPSADRRSLRSGLRNTVKGGWETGRVFQLMAAAQDHGDGEYVRMCERLLAAYAKASETFNPAEAYEPPLACAWPRQTACDLPVSRRLTNETKNVIFTLPKRLQHGLQRGSPPPPPWRA